jgi:hypothetical protein
MKLISRTLGSGLLVFSIMYCIQIFYSFRKSFYILGEVGVGPSNTYYPMLLATLAVGLIPQLIGFIISIKYSTRIWALVTLFILFFLTLFICLKPPYIIDYFGKVFEKHINSTPEVIYF